MFASFINFVFLFVTFDLFITSAVSNSMPFIIQEIGKVSVIVVVVVCIDGQVEGGGRWDIRSPTRFQHTRQV